MNINRALSKRIAIRFKSLTNLSSLTNSNSCLSSGQKLIVQQALSVSTLKENRPDVDIYPELKTSSNHSQESKGSRNVFKGVAFVLATSALLYGWLKRKEVKKFLTYESGLARSLLFWIRVFPIYVHYRSLKALGDFQLFLESEVLKNPSSPVSSFILHFKMLVRCH